MIKLFLKTILKFLKIISFLVLGCVFSYWFLSVERLKDEYVYVLKINQLILYDKNPTSLINKELNNLLYMHSNRYFNIRDSLPDVLKKESDELFCSLFLMEENAVKYKELITKPKLYDYLNEKMNFCPFDILTKPT
mgnify:CR=1 FL=1